MTRSRLTLFIFLYIISSSLIAQIRCSTMQADSALRIAHPNLGSIELLEKFIKEELEHPNPKRIIGDVYTIPVVIHIIHNGDALGVNANITDAQAISQITVLNEDFRRIFGTAGYNTHPDGADTKIEFCFAQRKPDGTPTNGIDRVNRNTAGFAAPPYSNTGYIDNVIKPATTWDASRYFNFWSIDLGSSLLGYAQFPSASGLNGFDCDEGLANSDGIVCHFRAFGRGFPNLYASYNQGKTATHEVGHWLGLRHIWGDATCGDDFCADTPTHQTSNSGCPGHPKPNSCGTADEMYENYMDYSGDGCLNIFTNDQKTRMRTVLNSSPLRQSLINSDACIPPSVNDAAVVDIINLNQDICAGNFAPIISIKNFGSANLTSATINYKLDSNPTLTVIFTGNLATLVTSNFTIPALNLAVGNHTLKVFTTLPNNSVDPNPAQDTIVINFNVSAGASIPYNEGFESNVFPPSNWFVNNISNDCFTFREQTGIIGPLGTQTTAAFLYHFLYTPGAAETDELISSLVDLTSITGNLDLEFDLAYARKSSTQYEDLKVEISTDCGQTYSTILYNKSGNVSGANDLRTVSNNQGSYWKPTSASNWRHETIDLSPFFGNIIRLKFTTTNRGGNNLFIDNIKLDNSPKVSFAIATTSFTESSATGSISCQGYLDVNLPISISANPASNVIVNASIISGSATISDANIIGTATFTNGGSLTQNLTFRIYDDEATEALESLTVLLNIVSGTASVSSVNGSIIVSIIDNDNYPFLGAATTLFTEDFETTPNGLLPTNWSVTTPTGGAGNNNWVVGSNGGMTGTKSCYITNDAATQNLNYDIVSTSRRRLVSPLINTTGIYNLVLSFDYKCNGEKFGSTYYDFGRLMYATNPTGPYTDVLPLSDVANTTNNASLVNFFNVSNQTSFSIQLPSACENQSALYLVWRWDNDNSEGTPPPFVIDNISLKYYGSLIPVETVINSTVTKYLPGNSTVFFVSNNNKLLAKIKNNSSFDYGCTTVTLSRAGNSAKEYWSTGVGNHLADKTLLVSPTNNSASGNLDITIYLTNTEVTGWQTATSKTFTSTARMHKSNGDIANITSLTPLANGTTNIQVGTSTIHSAYGSDRQVTANIATGFKTNGAAGFGVGDCANRIVTGSVSSTLCSSNSNSIPFVALGLFNTGNIFTAQMSDNAGLFGTPVNLTPTITVASNGYYANTINATNIPVTTNGSFYKFRINASNPSTPVISDNGVSITVQPRGLWLGNTSDFNLASNWCGGVPTSTTNILLQTGVSFQPSLTANSICSNLTLPTGTNLSLSNFTLSVNGNFSGNGLLTGSSNAGLSILNTGNAGTFFMNSNNSASKTLNNLILNRTGASAGVSIGDTLNLRGTLSISNGTLTTNNLLKLVSTSSSTANISAISGTGAIMGNVVSQKYAPGGKTGWSMMSNAIIGDNILNWQDDFPTSGFIGNTGSAGTFTSVYTYNEAANGTSANGYTPPTNATNTVVNGQGYFVYLGDGFDNTNPITIDATGTVRQGNYNLPVSYTASTPSALTNDDGWNLVANPYCSNIDWNSASWTKTNINNAIYIYNADGPYYSAYVSGVGVNGGTNIISQNQAFWVKANAPSPLLLATENIKTATSTPFLRSSQNQNQTPQDSIARIKLVRVSNNFQDETIIRIIEGSTTNFDNNFDAVKLMSLNTNAVNIYSSLNNNNFAINSIPPSSIPIEIPIPIKIAQLGLYDIQFTIPIAIGNNLYWKDNFLGTQVSLNNLPNLNYLFTDTVTPLTRFSLGLSNNIFTENKLQSKSNFLEVYPNPASSLLFVFTNYFMSNAEISITDALGKEVLYKNGIKSGNEIDISILSKGIYNVKVANDSDVMVSKFIKE